MENTENHNYIREVRGEFGRTNGALEPLSMSNYGWRRWLRQMPTSVTPCKMEMRECPPAIAFVPIASTNAIDW